MKTQVTRRRAKTTAEILDRAVGNLLRALKRDMLKKEGCVNLDQLRKNGDCERVLVRLKLA